MSQKDDYLDGFIEECLKGNEYTALVAFTAFNCLYPDHFYLDCSCNETEEQIRRRKKEVQRKGAAFIDKHGRLPPCELIERWLGLWDDID